MAEIAELNLDVIYAESENHPAVMDAFDRASDQDQSSWFTQDGKKVAAIVPPEVLDRYIALMAALERRP
jgi:hypothetical protein